MGKRIEKLRFEITFHGARIGVCKHVIARSTEEAALMRLKAAYPDQRLTVINVRKLVRFYDVSGRGQGSFGTKNNLIDGGKIKFQSDKVSAGRQLRIVT